jgi:hypothetical protein
MKRVELREFLRVAHFAAVEKDGTAWAHSVAAERLKSKNASRMLALLGKTRSVT